MERQLGQMVRLVDDLLDLNRITHNKLELRKTSVALATVIAQAVEACRPIIDGRGQKLAVALPEEPCDLHADPGRLAQVFANLLNNSSKYTDRGGQISLSAQRDDQDVVVRVRDTGIGIPPDKLATVFDMFSQVDSAHSLGGLGLGLTIVKRLVGMHGGSVEARSPGLGQGSEFIVRLPDSAVAAAARRSTGRGAETVAATPATLYRACDLHVLPAGAPPARTGERP